MDLRDEVYELKDSGVFYLKLVFLPLAGFQLSLVFSSTRVTVLCPMWMCAVFHRVLTSSFPFAHTSVSRAHNHPESSGSDTSMQNRAE